MTLSNNRLIRHKNSNGMDNFINYKSNLNSASQKNKDEDKNIFDVTPDDLEEVEEIEKEIKTISLLKETFDEDHIQDQKKLKKFTKLSQKKLLEKLYKKHK